MKAALLKFFRENENLLILSVALSFDDDIFFFHYYNALI